MQKEDLSRQVYDKIQQIRPYLQNDGGDVELVEVTAEGVARVRLSGACSGCPHSHMTLHNGIRATLLRDIPSLQDVISVGDMQ